MVTFILVVLLIAWVVYRCRQIVNERKALVDSYREHYNKYPNASEFYKHCPVCGSTNIKYSHHSVGYNRNTNRTNKGASLRSKHSRVGVRSGKSGSSSSVNQKFVNDGLCKECGAYWNRDTMASIYNELSKNM